VFKTIKIVIFLFVFPLLGTNAYSADVIGKGTDTIDKSKKVLKSLTRKSLKDKEIKDFLSKYVITIDDERGDGIVIYYFDDKIYKRYKELEFISEDKWKVSYLDKKLKIYYGDKKVTWKIQPGKKNIINIKEKITSTGKEYHFSYQDKTDYHVALEGQKLKKKD
jgi:hypothetical protein